jgi:hypothetical protein
VSQIVTFGGFERVWAYNMTELASGARPTLSARQTFDGTATDVVSPTVTPPAAGNGKQHLPHDRKYDPWSPHRVVPQLAAPSAAPGIRRTRSAWSVRYRMAQVGCDGLIMTVIAVSTLYTYGAPSFATDDSG